MPIGSLAPFEGGANNARASAIGPLSTMSTDLQTCRQAEQPPAGSVAEDLPLFRFGLRQLLFLVTVASLLLTGIVSSHGVTALALVLATLVVVLHLFSTALGTQLRWHANRALAHDANPHEAIDFARRSPPRPLSRSPWHGRGSTPLPWLRRLVVAMSLAGGALGALLLTASIGHRTSLAGIVVGSVSIAVVTGWFAFLGCSFYCVFRHGLRDAMADDPRDQQP